MIGYNYLPPWQFFLLGRLRKLWRLQSDGGPVPPGVEVKAGWGIDEPGRRWLAEPLIRESLFC